MTEPVYDSNKLPSEEPMLQYLYLCRKLYTVHASVPTIHSRGY